MKDTRRAAADNISKTLATLGQETRAGRLRGAAPLHDLATPAGPSDTVTAPLSYLYLLRQVDREFLSTEFTRDAKYSTEQYLFLVHGERVSKDELLDPTVDDDTTDYSNDSIPWEQSPTPTEDKPFQLDPSADEAQRQGVLDLLAK